MRLLLAQRLEIERAGLAHLLRSEGIEVCEVSEWNALAPAIQTQHPDLLIIDFDFCSPQSVEVVLNRVRLCVEWSKGAGVVVLGSSFRSTAFLAGQFRKAGASGYLSKAAAVPELIECARQVGGGGVYFSSVELTSIDSDRDTSRSLTSRQEEVLVLIVGGLSTKEIAVKLNRSVKTIDCHRAELMKRLQIYDVAGLVKFAIKIGLVRI